MILFYAPQSCALASHIALEHAGASYEARRVDFAANEQRSPDFMKVNPKGRVPALVTDEGILTESPAILAYIAQAYPDAALAPLDDPFAFGQVQSFNSFLCSTVHVAHAHNRRGYRWVDDAAAIEAMKRKVPQTMLEAFGLIENEFLRGPWVMGEQYTICDMYLFTMSRWLESDGVSVSDLPRVLAHREAMSADPVVRRVLDAELGAAA